MLERVWVPTLISVYWAYIAVQMAYAINLERFAIPFSRPALYLDNNNVNQIYLEG